MIPNILLSPHQSESTAILGVAASFETGDVSCPGFDKEDNRTSRLPDLEPSPAQLALFETRTVLIFGEIDMRLAERVTAQLLAMAAESDDDIRIVINSPGGHVESGDTIHDVLKFVGARVKMIGTGWVASAGAHIYIGAARQNRFCLPHTRFLLHQPLGGVAGPVSDIFHRGQ